LKYLIKLFFKLTPYLLQKIVLRTSEVLKLPTPKNIFCTHLFVVIHYFNKAADFIKVTIENCN